MLYRSLGVLFALFTVSGCATKSQFTYNHPPEHQAQNAASMVAAVVPVKDRREGKKIDAIYKGDPLKDIQAIAKEELLSTGVFRDVIVTPNENKDVNVNLMVEISLEKMNWEVPGYDAMVGKVFVVSFLTGGIGGVIYGSTETEVYGDINLHARITETRTGNVLLDNLYTARCMEKMAKLQCDTPETKAKMVGKSLQKIMSDMKADVYQTLSNPNKVSVSSNLGTTTPEPNIIETKATR